MTDPLAPDGAVASPVEPAIPAPTGGRVPVRAPDGTVGTIDASDLSAAATRGFTPLVGHDLEVEQARPEFEDATGRAASFSTGALRSMSLGLSDKAFIAGARLTGGDAGAEGFRRNLNLSGEINSGTETAGEVAGLFAPTGLTGIAAKAGGLAGKGVGLAAKGLARALPAVEGLAGRIGVAGAKAAASGAVEGLFYGAGNVVSEDALGDHETTAEKLWAGAQKGALFGGLAGGALGTGAQAGQEAFGALGSTLRRRAPEGAAGRLNREATEAGVGGVAEGAIPIPRPVSEQLEKSNMGLPKGGPATSTIDSMAAELRARQTGVDAQDALKHVFESEATLGKVDDALDASTRRVTKSLNEAMHVDDVIAPRIAFGEGKAEQMAKLVDTTNWSQQYETALQMRNAVDARVKWFESVSDQGGSGAAVKRLKESVATFDERMNWSIANAAKEQVARDAFIYADRLKRSVGAEAGFGQKFRKDVQLDADKLYHESLLKPLEDASIWGPAGPAQAAVNASTATKLQTSDALRNSFLTNFETVGGRPLTRFDPSDIKTYLRGIGGAENDLKKEALDRWSSGLRGQLDAIEEHYTVSASEKAEFASARKALDTFQSEMGAAEKQATIVKNARAMKEAETGRAIGGLVGLATDAFTRPIAVAERLGQLRRLANRTDAAVNDGIEGFFTGKAGAARAPLPKAEAERIMGETKQLAANPPALIERVSKAFTGISEAAPKVATFLSTKALQSMVWLADRAPRNTMSVSSLTPQLAKPVYSDAQLASFGRAYQAMNEPTSVLEDMKNGAITREGVDYLKANQPRLYAQIRTGMLEKLAVAKEPLPYEKRMQLGILFGIDADPTLNAAFVAAIQQTKAAPPVADASPGAVAPAANGSGRHGKPIDSKSYMTESERIASQ